MTREKIILTLVNIILETFIKLIP